MSFIEIIPKLNETLIYPEGVLTLDTSSSIFDTGDRTSSRGLSRSGYHPRVIYNLPIYPSTYLFMHTYTQIHTNYSHFTPY